MCKQYKKTLEVVDAVIETSGAVGIGYDKEKIITWGFLQVPYIAASGI